MCVATSVESLKLSSGIEVLAIVVKNLGIGVTAVEKTYTVGDTSTKERIEF